MMPDHYVSEDEFPEPDDIEDDDEGPKEIEEDHG
jgi:hypothetical protein